LRVFGGALAKNGNTSSADGFHGGCRYGRTDSVELLGSVYGLAARNFSGRPRLCVPNRQSFALKSEQIETRGLFETSRFANGRARV
jgi:hypothetical protein